MPPRLGFVGLGNMGRPMAERLVAAGYRLALADAAPERLSGFPADRVARPGSLAALAGESDIVITMLPDGKAVRAVVLGTSEGSDCVAAGLAPGSLVIDMSSSAPMGTRALGEALAARGIGLVDAPVSGGVKRAVDGSLAIMAGGEAALVERCRPILEAMGSKIFTTGPLGSGHAMKALNNSVGATGFVAAIEALRIGQRFGLDPEIMTDILNASTGRNNATEVKLKPFVIARNFASGFALGLMAKDVRTALDTARATETPAPLAERSAALWDAAAQALGGAADHTAILLYLEGLAQKGE
jgi:3-hydroxyisobutyrate dehydrogenase